MVTKEKEDGKNKTKFDQQDGMKRKYFNAQFALNYIGKLQNVHTQNRLSIQH